MDRIKTVTFSDAVTSDSDTSDADSDSDDDDKFPYGAVEDDDGQSVPAPKPWFKRKQDEAKARSDKQTLLSDIKNNIAYHETHAFLNALEETDVDALKRIVADKVWESKAVQDMITRLIDSSQIYIKDGEKVGCAFTRFYYQSR